MSIHEVLALRLLPSDVDDQFGPPFLFVRDAPTVPGPYGVPGQPGLPTAIGMHFHSRNSRSANVNRPSVTSFVVCRRGLLRNSFRGVLPGQESPYRGPLRGFLRHWTGVVLAKQLPKRVDEDLLSGRGSLVFVGSCDELAVFEHGAGADEGNEVRCVGRAPATGSS